MNSISELSETLKAIGRSYKGQAGTLLTAAEEKGLLSDKYLSLASRLAAAQQAQEPDHIVPLLNELSVLGAECAEREGRIISLIASGIASPGAAQS